MYNSIIYTNHILDFGAIGAGVCRFHSGNIIGYNEEDKQTEIFYFQEYKVTISYANKINEKISAGVNINVINSRMDNANATGIGADAGMIYNVFDFLRLGFVSYNIFRPTLSLGSENEGVPQIYKFGVLGKFGLENLEFLLDIDFSIGENEKFKINEGTEIKIFKLLSLRIGFNDGILAYGAGFTIYGFSLDYAYIFNNNLYDLYKLNFSYKFGPDLKEQEKIKKEELYRQVKALVEEKIKIKEMEMAKKHYVLAYSFYKQGKYDDALSEVDKSLGWNSNFKEAMIMKKSIATIFFKDAEKEYFLGDYINALEKFKRIEIMGDWYKDKIENYLSEINNKLKIKKDAKEFFIKGSELYAKKDFEGAYKIWQKALDLDPENKDLKINILKVKDKIGSIKEKISQEKIEYKEKLYLKGINLYTEGKLEEAISLWKKVIEIDPDDIKALRGIEKAQIEIEELKKRGIK